jgi:hypothetical protein
MMAAEVGSCDGEPDGKIGEKQSQSMENMVNQRGEELIGGEKVML